MKVHLKIFLPGLPEAIGVNDLDFEFAGATINDLIESLIEQYGQKAREALYDEQGKFDPIVQILLNGEEWVTHDQLDKTLQDGDNIMLVMMMAGG